MASPGRTEASAKGADSAGSPFSASYQRYAMSLLLAIGVINYLDRYVINIIAEPLKNDLGLADWQLGLLTGLAFGVLYTLLGLPIARIAERRNRPLIIATATGVWSLFTVCCGLVQHFWQLALARVGVGIGEAGCTPPAHSLIMDYAPPEKRSSSLAFYGLGSPIGGLLGMVFGGLVADAYGWRMAFLIAGAPGLLFAVLAALTLKEPRNFVARHATRVKAASATLGETLRSLGSKRSYYFIAAGITLKSFIGIGSVPFLASFYLRNHSKELAETASNLGAVFGFELGSVGFLGIVLGLMAGIGGAMGVWSGGVLADRFGRADPRQYAYVPAIAAVAAVPLFFAAMTVPSVAVSLILAALHAFVAQIWYGPAFAAAYSVAPAHMRATSAAIILFLSNLLGLGLGPLGVGILSDIFGASLGSGEGLRWALISLSSFGLVTGYVFWQAARTLREDAAQ